MTMRLVKHLFAGIVTIALLLGTSAITFAAGGGGGSGTGSGGGNSGGSGDGSIDPVTFLGAYLTTISGNESTQGKELKDNLNVDPSPTIKLVFNKNVVNATVWDTNSKAIELTDDAVASNNKVAIEVSRIPDEGENANPNEKRNIFISPKEPLTLGKSYTITIKSSLVANNTSTLGKKETITFTIKTDIIAPTLTVNTPDQATKTNQDKIVVAGTTESGSTVKINDTIAPVDENGLFSQEITLSPGLNKVSITSTDGADNKASVELQVTYDPSTPAGDQNESPGTPATPGTNENGGTGTIESPGTTTNTGTNGNAAGTASAVKANTTSTTTTGHELPATASNTFNLLASGLLLFLVGFGLMMRPKYRR
jgi:Glucodextranase, domain B